MYSFGDETLYLWDNDTKERRLLFGKPLDQREEGEQVPLLGLRGGYLTPHARGLLLASSLYDDSYGLAYFPLDNPDAIAPVEVTGTKHLGQGEVAAIQRLEETGDCYLLFYNIDGVSYVYEGRFDEEAKRFEVLHTLVGTGPLRNGVLDSIHYDKHSGDFALSFSTATDPAQIYTIIGEEREVGQITKQRILGIPRGVLSGGEDYPYTTHDGLRISSRLYLPAGELGFEAPYPVIFYIHGGPQSQERPDFTWFSMPLIQFFTLNGFAVWVPNVRGSQGYGMEYMKRVDHDWGGEDRLDHIAAYELLKQDERLDMSRVGVMGRSYGGYMTLTLAGRHPELWGAAIDMFGPYNLFTFMDRLPETWQTYFHHAVGHPEKDRDFLTERSPSTHLHQLQCPLLVIQGANDPRVVERESRDLVERLREQGKEVDLIVFEDEGHDVLKFPNKVRCYNGIVDFFKTHLNGSSAS
jgi:dipeptidyl aminopeptidase/acylaminoacyl peptidase